MQVCITTRYTPSGTYLAKVLGHKIQATCTESPLGAAQACARKVARGRQHTLRLVSKLELAACYELTIADGADSAAANCQPSTVNSEA